jgi:hypothetical protein
MAMTFDATLKQLGRDSPHGILAAFDRPPSGPIQLLNVDLSTVTMAADLVVGLGEPLEEIIHFEFQSSAAAWKHADVMAYNAQLFRIYHVPVHTVVVLLRPAAAHPNMNGAVAYAARPGRGKMDFSYELVPLWERPAEELLAADLGVTPLAMLGSLPEGPSLEDRLGAVARRLVERVINEAPTEQVQRLVTEAYLLTGLRVLRDTAKQIFRGVPAMQESDTYLGILEEGEEKHARKAILLFGGKKLGPPDASIKTRLESITDLERLDRMMLQAPTAATWEEILDTP